jgi:hypothetical protein
MTSKGRKSQYNLISAQTDDLKKVIIQYSIARTRIPSWDLTLPYSRKGALFAFVVSDRREA